MIPAAVLGPSNLALLSLVAYRPFVCELHATVCGLHATTVCGDIAVEHVLLFGTLDKVANVTVSLPYTDSRLPESQ